ncbi:sigma-70 family RNA polymerase sigma factor [Ectothiorhodospiraceae bacterium WFHF3C12]|nr:sigma-70 family RNA polymerase sigma factor [Ectothiorhodospiraceae bacterium WFHF3C12]
MAVAESDRPQGAEERRRIFEREIDRLADRLYGTALRLTRDPEDAEDVVAEAVTRAWSKLDELRHPDQFEGWLFRILNNTFVSLWRRRRCRQDRETELNLSEGEEDGPAPFSLFEQLHQPFLLWWGTPEKQVLDGLLREDIQSALDALPDAFRVTMVMVEVEGYTYQEVSDLLDIPLGTVRSRLNRARSLLQASLWERAREAGLVHGVRKPRARSNGGGG